MFYLKMKRIISFYSSAEFNFFIKKNKGKMILRKSFLLTYRLNTLSLTLETMKGVGIVLVNVNTANQEGIALSNRL